MDDTGPGLLKVLPKQRTHGIPHGQLSPDITPKLDLFRVLGLDEGKHLAKNGKGFPAAQTDETKVTHKSLQHPARGPPFLQDFSDGQPGLPDTLSGRSERLGVKFPPQDQPSLTNGLNLMHNKACRLEKIVPFGGSSSNALSTSACINKVVDINDMHGVTGRRGAAINDAGRIRAFGGAADNPLNRSLAPKSGPRPTHGNNSETRIQQSVRINSNAIEQ